MSVSQDFYLAADVSRETLSSFLADECDLQVEGANRRGMPIHRCDDFSCHVVATSSPGRDLIREEFGFEPAWHLSFYLSDISRHDSHPQMLETMLLLILEYDSDCVWLTNGEFPQFLKRSGKLTIQGAHSRNSDWADNLRRFAEKTGLPHEVAFIPIV